MSYQNSFYRAIDRIINKLKLYGFNSVTYGTEKDLDFSKRTLQFPTAHIIFSSGSILTQSTSVGLVIVVADKLDKTNDGTYTEYGDGNIIDIQQDLLVRITTT